MKRSRSSAQLSQTPRGEGKKRRMNRKVRRRPGPYIMSVKGQTPFPDVYRCKMKYHHTKTVSTGGLNKIQFEGIAANGLYDPDLNTGGQQPVGFDELSAIYSQYVVRGCKVEATFFSNETNTRCIVGVFANTNTLHHAVLSDVNPLLCQKYVKHSNLGVSTSGQSVATVSMYKSTSEVVGQREIDPSDFGSATSANPTKLWYYDIFVASADDSDATITCEFNVSVTYYVDFYDQKYLDLS